MIAQQTGHQVQRERENDCGVLLCRDTVQSLKTREITRETHKHGKVAIWRRNLNIGELEVRLEAVG